MGYDADENENDYIDYLAEEKSGFMGESPVHLIGMDEACRRIVHPEMYGDLLIEEDDL